LTQFAEFPHPLETTTSHFTQVLTTANKPLGLFPVSKEYTDESATQYWFTPKDLTVARPMKSNTGWRWVREGRAEGIMFGGTLPWSFALAEHLTIYLPITVLSCFLNSLKASLGRNILHIPS
ncbi:hypothetical protein CPB84DRAFT_1776977, partial [Gymnopilus junonius]